MEKEKTESVYSNPKYIPQEITRLYIAKNQTQIQLTEYFICGYLGQHNVFVTAMKPISENSWLLTVRFKNNKEMDELLYAKETPFTIRRVFKSGFYSKDGFLTESKSTIGKVIVNLFGLVNGKKAIIGMKVNSAELKKLYVDFALQLLDAKDNKFDCDIDPKKANIWLNVQKVETPNRLGMITWLDDPNKIIRNE